MSWSGSDLGRGHGCCSVISIFFRSAYNALTYFCQACQNPIISPYKFGFFLTDWPCSVVHSFSLVFFNVSLALLLSYNGDENVVLNLILIVFVPFLGLNLSWISVNPLCARTGPGDRHSNSMLRLFSYTMNLQEYTERMPFCTIFVHAFPACRWTKASFVYSLSTAGGCGQQQWATIFWSLHFSAANNNQSAAWLLRSLSCPL